MKLLKGKVYFNIYNATPGTEISSNFLVVFINARKVKSDNYTVKNNDAKMH